MKLTASKEKYLNNEFFEFVARLNLAKDTESYYQIVKLFVTGVKANGDRYLPFQHKINVSSIYPVGEILRDVKIDYFQNMIVHLEWEIKPSIRITYDKLSIKEGWTFHTDTIPQRRKKTIELLDDDNKK